jgi:hypothetical protein
MDPTLRPLKAAFEAIRDTAMTALSQIEQSQEERSMQWKCKECEYIKHFTKSCSFGSHCQMPPDAKAPSLDLFSEVSSAKRASRTARVPTVKIS